MSEAMINYVNNYLQFKNLYFVPTNNGNIIFKKIENFEYTYQPLLVGEGKTKTFCNNQMLYVEICNNSEARKNMKLYQGYYLLLSKHINQKIFIYKNLNPYIIDNMYQELSVYNNNFLIEYLNYIYFGNLNIEIKNVSFCFTKIKHINIELAIPKTCIDNDIDFWTTRYSNEDILKKHPSIKIIYNITQTKNIMQMIMNISNVKKTSHHKKAFLNNQLVYIDIPGWLIDLF